MFDSHFRTLFLSTPVHLSHRNGHLMIGREDGTKVSIPLADILCVICESPQITLSASLLDCFASEKIVLFTCDQSHLPSGILTPLVGHYKALSIVQAQSALSKQKKAILWQKIIKQKLYNQALLLECVQKIKESQKILQLYKQVRLNDTSNHEAQAAALYFPALFFKGFRRNGMQEKNINAALNYGYAIIRGMIARSICASGLHAAFGIFHCNQLNAFNLVDDMIEPYRIFVDSVVWQMYHDCMLNVELQKAQRVQLAEILSASVLLLDGKTYPLYRAVISSVQSLVQNMIAETELNLPVFDKEKSNGREVYESTSDV